MGDMLIRGIDSELKRRLEDSARRNGRSLSEEAVAAIRKAFATHDTSTQKAGDRLYALVGNVYFTDDELGAIEASRSEEDRAPPNLE